MRRLSLCHRADQSARSSVPNINSDCFLRDRGVGIVYSHESCLKMSVFNDGSNLCFCHAAQHNKNKKREVSIVGCYCVFMMCSSQQTGNIAL